MVVVDTVSKKHTLPVNPPVEQLKLETFLWGIFFDYIE